jgi:hypothetical protein
LASGHRSRSSRQPFGGRGARSSASISPSSPSRSGVVPNPHATRSTVPKTLVSRGTPLSASIGTDRTLEQQRRTGGGDGPAVDFGDIEHGGNRRAYPPELAGRLEEADESGKVRKLRLGSGEHDGAPPG